MKNGRFRIFLFLPNFYPYSYNLVLSGELLLYIVYFLYLNVILKICLPQLETEHKVTYKLFFMLQFSKFFHSLFLGIYLLPRYDSFLKKCSKIVS